MKTISYKEYLRGGKYYNENKDSLFNYTRIQSPDGEPFTKPLPVLFEEEYGGDTVEEVYRGLLKKELVQLYCGYNFAPFNKFLREGNINKFEDSVISLYRMGNYKNGVRERVPMSLEEKTELLIEAVIDNKTPSNITVYRSMSVESFYKYKDNNLFCDKGFMSTCGTLENLYDSEFDYKDKSAFLEIYIKKGEPAMHVLEISKRDNEDEWLLPPDTRLLITDMKKDEVGRLRVTSYAIERNRDLDISEIKFIDC